MSILSTSLTPGFAALHAVLGDTCTISGVTGFLGTFTEEKQDDTFADFSNRENITRTWAGIKSQFVSRPDPSLRPLLVFGTLTYEIIAISEDQIHYILTLRRVPT